MLYLEIFDFSIIPNKHIVYVNDGNQFRSKEDIYNEITKILNKNYKVGYNSFRR